MERARRLAAFWSWLPAFRAVAESEHLPTASRLLNVTASSLSRTIRLLEEDLGTQLFERTGRNIRLNDTGAAFLQATREAMRVVHEALAEATGDRLHGPIHCSAPTPLAAIVFVPAMRALRETYPALSLHLHAMVGESMVAKLKRGELDLALTDDAVDDDALTVDKLMTLRHDVFAAERIALEDVVFIAPRRDDQGHTPDAWPAHRSREIGARVDLMQTAIDVVRSGAPFGAVLPCVVGESNGLVSLGLAGEMNPSVLYAVRRRTLSMRTKADVLAEAIAKTFQAERHSES
ncbi:MAG: LysR family transcriptional regulator [Myxococcota bacterium]